MAPDHGDLGPNQPFLSVVVPTFNRAEKLDRQLAWLHGELSALPVAWEVRVHDNCSTDETPDVLARWREAFGPERFDFHRNVANIGLMPNLAQAMEDAKGRWTWSIGDDDRLYDGTAQLVVDTLLEQPDLAMLFLNYRGVDADGEETRAHYFDPGMTGRFEDGMVPFEYHTHVEMGSTIFLTANIYRTELIRAALADWDDDRANWALLAYLAGHVCANGPVFLTRENRIDCLVGQSHWQRDPVAWASAMYYEIPLAFLRLAQLGYPATFCQELGFRAFEAIRWSSARSHLRGLRTHPDCVVTLSRLRTLPSGGAARR
jgi:glycosyltransferase involved in cell wall biosynthesis